MDSTQWNGADDRDWPSVDEPCQGCGVSPSRLCLPTCDCEDCQDRRPSAQGDGDPGLLETLTYISYKAQRQLCPEIDPSRWAVIYDGVEAMEARYQAELETAALRLLGECGLSW